MFNYVSLTVVRNEEKAISVLIDSVRKQTIQPKYMMIVDDGSTDKTSTILKIIKSTLTDINMIIKTRKDRGFSALNSYNLYLLADAYNSGLNYLLSKSDWDWLVILPADCLISETYMEEMLNVMIGGFGVASGSPYRHKEFEGYKENQPTGGGMVIHRKIFEYMGGLYPRNNDYEFSVVHCSRLLNLEVGRFENIIYDRKRLSGSKESQPFISWGRGMKDGNYHPIYAIGRIAKELLLKHDLNKGLKLLVGYLAQPKHDYPDYAIFLRQYQQFSIRTGINKILHKLRLV